MKIYVAGSSKTPWIERAKEVMRSLEDDGHEVTFDWTFDVKAGRYDASCALNDLDAVARADVLFATIAPEVGQRGTYIEIGAALALGKKVLIDGKFDVVFQHHPNVIPVTSYENLLHKLGIIADEM